MNDALWMTTQRFKSLQQYIDELRWVWSDHAQKEIYTHFLQPHEENGEQTVVELEQQDKALQQVTTKLEMVEGLMLQAHTAAENVNNYVIAVESAMHDSWYHYEQYLRYNQAAQSQIPHIQQLIEHAKARL